MVRERTERRRREKKERKKGKERRKWGNGEEGRREESLHHCQVFFLRHREGPMAEAKLDYEKELQKVKSERSKPWVRFSVN